MEKERYKSQGINKEYNQDHNETKDFYWKFIWFLSHHMGLQQLREDKITNE